MRARSLVPAAAAVLFAASCPERQPPPLQQTSSATRGRHTVTVDGAILRYDSRELRWDLPEPRWEEVLGPRSRRVGDISTWDELGVFLFHSHDDEAPHSFAVLLGRKPFAPDTRGEPDYWPRQTFDGLLVVDGAVIQRESTVQEILRTKKGVPLRRGHLRTVYEYYVGDFYMAFELGYDMSLTSFSVSQRAQVRHSGNVEPRRP